MEDSRNIICVKLPSGLGVTKSQKLLQMV